MEILEVGYKVTLETHREMYPPIKNTEMHYSEKQPRGPTVALEELQNVKAKAGESVN